MKLFRDLTVDYAKMITLIRKTIICQLYLIIKKSITGHRPSKSAIPVHSLTAKLHCGQGRAISQ